MNNLNFFLEKIQCGEVPLGLVVTSSDPAVSELAAACGMDFIWIDGEHSPLTIHDIYHHILSTKGTRCAPFVRVGANLPHLLKPVLDLNPAGVIIPMIKTAEDARQAVSFCRYPDFGGDRGYSLRRNHNFGAVPFPEYLESSRTAPHVILQIEHRTAVENLKEILQVEGVGSVCIGPCDLSGSYGKAGQWDDPEIIHAIDFIREETLATRGRVLLGGFCAGPFWEKRFMQWRAIAEDTAALATKLRELIRKNTP